MGDVLPYKWEAYCSTNGRRTAGFPFLRTLEARKVRRYKWGGAYCRTNWRCTAVLFGQVVGVGVSATLPINRNSMRNPSCAGWEGEGLMGTKIVNKNVVNKLAFPNKRTNENPTIPTTAEGTRVGTDPHNYAEEAAQYFANTHWAATPHIYGPENKKNLSGLPGTCAPRPMNLGRQVVGAP